MASLDTVHIWHAYDKMFTLIQKPKPVTELAKYNVYPDMKTLLAQAKPSLSRCQAWNGTAPSSRLKQCFVDSTLSRVPILKSTPVLSPSHHLSPGAFLCPTTLEEINFYHSTKPFYHLFKISSLKASLYCHRASCNLPELR